MAEAKVQDQDAELGVYDEMWDEVKEGSILLDPDSSVVALICQIYQNENFCYRELNRSCRFKDTTKVSTLGPWAAALWWII